MRILTSVIGSYPPFDGAGKPATLEQAIQAQLDADKQKEGDLATGIDVVTDGQTSGDMIGIFAPKIPGIRKSNEKYEIHGGLAWPYRGITVRDQRLAKNYLARQKSQALLKGVITGPYTLAKACINNHYENEKEVAQAFAAVLNSELKELQTVVDVLQIDEPYFFAGVPEYAKDVFDVLTESVRKEIILHTHYARTTLQGLPKILALPVQTISYDSAANPIIIDLLARHKFKQKVSVGCVRTDGDYLTNVETIANRIRYAVNTLGIDKIKYVTPDCGLRTQRQNIANEMMRRVVAARNRLTSS